jgi:hypothetical protein
MIKISVSTILFRPTNSPRDFRPALAKFIYSTVVIYEHSGPRMSCDPLTSEVMYPQHSSNHPDALGDREASSRTCTQIAAFVQAQQKLNRHHQQGGCVVREIRTDFGPEGTPFAFSTLENKPCQAV